MAEVTDVQDAARTYTRKFNSWSVFGAGVWLVFLAPVFQKGWQVGGWRGWTSLVVTAVFCLAYLLVFLWSQPRRRGREAWRRLRPEMLAAWAGLGLLALAVVLCLGSTGLATTVYVAVAGIMLLPVWWAVTQAAVLAVGTELLARTVPGWDGADGIGLSVFLASFAVWGIMQAMRRSLQLVEAKDENSQLLVGQERARMARDLHDILGHSLTVITVKAELAGRLLDADDDAARRRARAEVADLERLARDALADVRRTVEGYRDLSLPGEITRARSALEAAEIEADLPGSTDEVPSHWRELFAWTLREGVTNVVRHSAARHCTVTLTPDRIRIVDDGRGCAQAVGEGGNGLLGLRERAGAVGATVVVETPPEGGFALSVLVPSVVRPVVESVVESSDPEALARVADPSAVAPRDHRRTTARQVTS